jgi:hypothetical protein
MRWSLGGVGCAYEQGNDALMREETCFGREPGLCLCVCVCVLECIGCAYERRDDITA